MRIAVLALQGAFAEHETMLQKLGVETFQVRQLIDWEQAKDGLIIPGGESTAQAKLLHDLGLYELVRQDIVNGLPVFGTCAGLIMLSSMHFGTMQIDVCRNAYGRQLGSFYTESSMEEVGDTVPMTFIRAPYIEKVKSADCKVLAVVDSHIVAARQGNQLVTAFHPELNDDLRVHSLFIDIVRQHQITAALKTA